MYCKNCGISIDENSKFCSNCGNEIIIETNFNFENDRRKEYKFSKVKQLGALNIAVIETTISIDNSRMYINEQRRILYFINGKRKVSTIILNEMCGVVTKTAIDTIDLIYAILFGVLGLIFPPAFIITAVCLFTGYGQRILIKQRSGVDVEIQAEKSPLVEEFIQYIDKYIDISKVSTSL